MNLYTIYMETQLSPILAEVCVDMDTFCLSDPNAKHDDPTDSLKTFHGEE